MRVMGIPWTFLSMVHGTFFGLGNALLAKWPRRAVLAQKGLYDAFYGVPVYYCSFSTFKKALLVAFNSMVTGSL